MTIKRIAGSVAAGAIAMGLAIVPVSAQAAPGATSVSATHAKAVSGVAERKKKKPKISIAVAPNPTGCYDISLRVTKRGVPLGGAVIRIQSLSRGKWRNTPDAPITTDANGATSFTNAGLHNASGGASNNKVRFRYKKNYSRGFHAPCAES